MDSCEGRAPYHQGAGVNRRPDRGQFGSNGAVWRDDLDRLIGESPIIGPLSELVAVCQWQ